MAVTGEQSKPNRRRTYVVGVGMTKYERVGSRPDWSYLDIGKEAILAALDDCQLSPDLIEMVFASYCFGDSCSGQRVFREISLSSVPVINVNNNCSSGSSALYLARNFIESGGDCALAFGFEKMEKRLTEKYPHFPSPIGPHNQAYTQLQQTHPSPPTNSSRPPTVLDLFTSAGKEYLTRHNTSPEVLAQIAYKNHRHAKNNSKACFQKELPLKAITNPKFKLTELLFTPMASPTTDGGAAALLVSEAFLQRHPTLRPQAVELLSQIMLSDLPDYHQTYANIVGDGLAREATRKLFLSTGYTIQNVDVIELHDCFATNELLLYDSLGLCPPGQAGDLITHQLKWCPTLAGHPHQLAQLGGKYYVNPSGGLMAKGHPLGATGLGQCYELCHQLRGDTEPTRQIHPPPQLGLQHNVGLGSSCVVTLYKSPTISPPPPPKL